MTWIYGCQLATQHIKINFTHIVIKNLNNNNNIIYNSYDYYNNYNIYNNYYFTMQDCFDMPIDAANLNTLFIVGKWLKIL